MGADVLAKVERRWPRRRHELGACLVWTGPQVVDKYGNVYGRMYDAAIGRTDYTHRVVCGACMGRFLSTQAAGRCRWTISAEITLCQRPDHLEAVTRAENTRRRHQRTHAVARPAETPTAVQRCALALFAAIDRPTVQAKSLTLDELVSMLTRFEVLGDKRGGRCWSPTRYADSATSRGNAGVLEVSALVFDLDRVPPDPKRLEGVCWLGHTTWSHTSLAPRWRVVIPLAEPVSAAHWPDIWRRARAALCPEADPSCKNPSRQYLPSHAPGASHQAMHHPGAMLDASTLPESPPEHRSELQRSPSATRPRKTTASDQRRGEAYMASVIAKLESMPPDSGRNNALNHAAWTLRRWVAAGALEQAQVEDALHAAAARNGLLGDDGERQCCWATIISGLGAGLQQPVDLDQ